jgi:hypothetical protein
MHAILNVTKLNRYLGEQIIALHSAGYSDGFILHSYEIDREKLELLIKNTSVSNFKIFDNMNQLRQHIYIRAKISWSAKWH